MARIDGEQLKQTLVQAQQAFEVVRKLTEAHVLRRIRERKRWEHAEDEEIADKVYEQVARALTSYDRSRAENPYSWFMTVVDHRVIDYCRANKIPLDSLDQTPRPSSDEEELEPVEPPDIAAPSPPTVLRQRKDHEILFEAMSGLKTPEEREMLLLVAFFPELRYSEIRKVTGHTSDNAAKEFKYRVMKRMREVLADSGYGWEMFGEMFRPE